MTLIDFAPYKFSQMKIFAQNLVQRRNTTTQCPLAKKRNRKLTCRT